MGARMYCSPIFLPIVLRSEDTHLDSAQLQSEVPMQHWKSNKSGLQECLNILNGGVCLVTESNLKWQFLAPTARFFRNQAKREFGLRPSLRARTTKRRLLLAKKASSSSLFEQFVMGSIYRYVGHTALAVDVGIAATFASVQNQRLWADTATWSQNPDTGASWHRTRTNTV